MTYEFSKDKATSALMLKSKEYRVTVLRAKGHVWVKITSIAYHGPKFKLQGLTSIGDKVNDFEMKVIALHFYRQARRYSKNMPTLAYVNYADIFGSCFD